jgi:hypothetical protein
MELEEEFFNIATKRINNVLEWGWVVKYKNFNILK